MSYFGIPIRNGLPIGLGSVAPLASGGGSPFSPLSLFSGGAPGAWYDPSDYTTLFQDSAGTTPVTAVEQPVGLMLDKSQGLVLGNNIFAVVSTQAAWSALGGGAYSANGTSGFIQTTNPLTSGKWYQASLRVVSRTSGSVSLPYNTVDSNYASSTGTHSYLFLATSASLQIYSLSFAGTIDNISVKELPGNHAFQATSASRPVLSARYNLLTKTEQFDDAAWSGANTTVVANTSGTTDPLGGNTADLLYPATTGNFRDRAQQVSSGESGIYTVSEYAKAGGFRWAYFRNLAANNYAAHFDLQTGTLGTVQAGVTATITPAGNGWYRCTITNTSPSATPWCAMGMSDVDNSATATVSGTNGIYVWGASTVPANQSTLPYQRVNTATDYATTGFLPYLKFEVDDSMSTNSIIFTATDKMSVFAGVRKLSNTGYQTIAELSANFGNNNGSFLVLGTNKQFAPDLEYAFAIKGTGSVIDATTNAASYTAPVTNVFTGIGDIAAPLVNLRLNGASIASSTASTGTGNYGNYPLFIGRRNNTGFPFNGQLYSLIIVGKAVTAGELSSTETYVNQKTGAY